MEIDQDELCEYCEENILGCKPCSSTFICEGCFCKEAKEQYLESLKEEKQ